MTEDFDTALNQYFYSVDTKGYYSTWSNSIGQVKSETEHTDANIGLKKQGEGTLYLTNANTFKGYDVYQGDSCYLRPYISGNISYISQDAYQEKGTSTSLLRVDKVDNTSTGIISGIALSYAFSKAVLMADFSYERILSGDFMQVSAYFLADGTKTKFDSLEVETDKNYFNAGLGIGTEFYRNTWLNLWAETRISDNTNAMNFTASVS